MGTMKTSRRLVGSSTGDAEMMCGEQQSASAALFTCGHQGEGARCCRAHQHTAMGTKFEISTTFVCWECGGNISVILTLVSSSWVRILYVFYPSPWLLAPNWCVRKQGAGWHVASPAQMLRTLAHYFRQCHNVRVSSVTNNFKQECNTRSWWQLDTPRICGGLVSRVSWMLNIKPWKWVLWSTSDIYAGVKTFMKGCGWAIYSVVAYRCQHLTDGTQRLSGLVSSGLSRAECWWITPADSKYNLLIEPCRLFQLFQINISVIPNT